MVQHLLRSHYSHRQPQRRNPGEEALVFLWGFACDGFREVVYQFSEGKNLIHVGEW